MVLVGQLLYAVNPLTACLCQSEAAAAADKEGKAQLCFQRVDLFFYRLLGQEQFLGGAYNPNVGSAMSLILMVIVLIIIGITNTFDSDEMEGMLV